ncbi:MAG: tRNA (guanosine(37)-N1)-methyltransferase TrmD [Burkholderiales bacterium]|jgi:tRNA (guanine37-N1)-methyltransferase|nr:tRNA (guanosine(37)-N1)-methyltransferase TrmD [Burkholderiales bacterium]MCA3155626.1 tRNA (guanosine(37)-N1)-methyltransferase TrmD [Burkholderiales bacterium]MCA3157930.1 tRNA (guanosine(37)-N1)-methyltransferase TrmD [Burkholderiales bacterium]MCA3158539.1 tRNA (guanosine(37)-N1)-methyltransferase TrmD [Burkholderiales bacterium]MCA3161313.1 tRNA (guanosine(37)-N1)-methyltransferase TrmD [Burkholderiales bacterium]
MRFEVVSLFPEMFRAITESGITARAWQQGLWQWQSWNPRDYSADPYRRVDDRPFGGGPGMVMLAEPMARAIESAQSSQPLPAPVLLLSPQGKVLTQQRLRHWAEQHSRLILVCGRYEAIDQRVQDALIDEEVSLGDFVLSGGEIAAMAVMDAIIRWLPGVLNDAQSAMQDSFADEQTGALLDCPHYTRPEVWRGRTVPEILLSGHHAKIAEWRREQALLTTLAKRPDLIALARDSGQLSRQDEQLLSRLAKLPDSV